MACRAVLRELSLPPDAQPRSPRVSGGRGSSIAGPTTAEVPLNTHTHTYSMHQKKYRYRTVKALRNFSSTSTSMTHEWYFCATSMALSHHYRGISAAVHVFMCISAIIVGLVFIFIWCVTLEILFQVPYHIWSTHKTSSHLACTLWAN